MAGCAQGVKLMKQRAVVESRRPRLLITRNVACRVKWFDPNKGYGFAVPDAGGDDVQLHVSILSRDGHEVTYEGSTMVCDVAKKETGCNVWRVISLDNSTAVVKDKPKKAQPLPRIAEEVVPTGEAEVTCKWFSWQRGFGFVTRGEGTPDIFVYEDTLLRCGITDLPRGVVFVVQYGPAAKGLMVTHIKIKLGGR